MRILLFSGIICLLSLCSAEAQIVFETALSPRIANYEFDIQLDTRNKIVSGDEKLTWKNSSEDMIEELQFHLYMNAFRNPNSTFLKNLSRKYRRIGDFDTAKSGGVDIERLILNNTVDLLDSIQYIQPDDNNPQDSTVIRVPLPKPVKPKEIIVLNMTFRTQLPEIIARTGYKHDYFLLGQWFPKIGVYIDGEWNCHQFHKRTEFFADFGVYDVNLTLPKDFKVGSSGVLLSEEIGDSLKTLNYRAEDVHDFALAAWPNFLEESREIEGVKVMLLYAPEHHGNVDRYFEAIGAALTHLGDWLMPYPYPNLTLIDMPLYAFRSAGMEYPCFITCGSLWGLPDNIRLAPEEVTVHEFAHQYFYGVLASNEFEEAWLDEGFTSYAALKVMNNHYGFHNSLSTFLNVRVGAYNSHKSDYLEAPDTDYVVKPGWKFEMGGYGTLVYDKAVLILQTLENYVGKALMNKILQNYITRWKFKHPSTGDFINIVNEMSPENMNWFFDQALFTTKILDYEVKQISFQEIDHENADSLVNQYISQVEIKRNGEFIFPIEVELTFKNGDTLLEHWDGKDPYRIFEYRRDSHVVSAQIDPENKIWLDLNWTNNSKTFQEDKTAFWRHWLKSMQFYQHILLKIGSL